MVGGMGLWQVEEEDEGDALARSGGWHD